MACGYHTVSIYYVDFSCQKNILSDTDKTERYVIYSVDV